MQLDLVGKIDETGKLSVFAQDDLRRWINGHRGKTVRLRLKAQGKKRSTEQNAYYWSVVVSKIKDRLLELGNEVSADDVHELLKSRFNAKEIDLGNGHAIDIPGSTTDMSTVDFMTYIERIQRFAAELLDIYIPDPNEQMTLDFHE